MEYLHGGDVYTYEGMIDFSVNLNPFGPSDMVLKAVEEKLAEIGQYPDSQAGKLRKALAAELQIREQDLIFGNGAAELIYLAVQAVRPKKAVIPVPSFAEYRQALLAADCEVTEYRLEEKYQFQLQEAFLEELTEETDMVFLCSPDNPSGCVIEKGLMERIQKRCEEKQIYLVVDECFVDFLPEENVRVQTASYQRFPHCLVLRAFTKMYAIPGLRLGYGISCNTALLEKMNQKRQPWSVSGLAQAAGCAAIREKDRVEKTKQYVIEERAWIEQRLNEIGVVFYPSQANYLLLKSPCSLFEELKKQGFLIRDCSNYRGLEKGYYRIAVKKHEENEKLMEALEAVYKRKERE